LTLLSWTAQPRLALLNPHGGAPGRHDGQWRAALQQFFSLVRPFNPLLAPFEQHLGLLRGMAEIHDPWRDGLLRGVEALARQRESRHREAATVLVDYLQDLMGFHLRLPVVGTRDAIRAQIGRASCRERVGSSVRAAGATGWSTSARCGAGSPA